LRSAKREPAINPGWILSGLPQSHIGEELRHDSVDNRGRQSQDQECREHAVLHVLNRVAKLPEGEAVEDADDY